MHDEHPHPLLAQVPLSVSPFLSLPTATPLPYTYKQLPSTLPPSVLQAPPASNQSDPSSAQQQQPPQPAYVTSVSGTAAHPDTILASCLALQSHLRELETNARNTLGEWEERRRAEDLAEKRRVAPGWLDGDVKLLRPENVQEGQAGAGAGAHAEARPHPQQRHSVGIQALVEKRDGLPDAREGEELDRAFGGLGIK